MSFATVSYPGAQAVNLPRIQALKNMIEMIERDADPFEI